MVYYLMQQILKETKIKYIYYTQTPPYPTYEKNNTKELLISNNLFITNPLSYKSGVQILDEEPIFRLVGVDLNYFEILSEEYFYIRLNNSFTLKTKSYNYYNANDGIDVEIAHGGLVLDPTTNSLTAPLGITPIKVEYVLATGI